MRTYRLLLVPVVAIAGGVVGSLPALTARAAPPTSASFTAVDFAWDASSGGTSVTIAAGGTVSFSYPKGASAHNVDFWTGPQPSSCEVNGAPQAPPVPSSPSPPGWTAQCTFASPGTYTFRCDMHHFMKGTVIVSNTTTTTTSTTTTTETTSPVTTGTTTQSPPTTTTPTTSTMSMTTYPGYPMTSTPTATGAPRSAVGSPLAVAASKAIRVFEHQRGLRVTGAIDVSSVGRGGRAVVTLRTRSGGHLLKIGHLLLRHLRAGRVRFAVALDRAAIALLRSADQLEITATITVAGPKGAPVTVSRHVHLRS